MADISEINVNNTLYNIEDATAVHPPLKTINNEPITGTGNIKLNTRARRMWYGTCSTSGATANKTVTTTAGDFTLTNGNMLVVKFTNMETSSGTNLAVDGNTAKPVYTTLNTTVNDTSRWVEGGVISFVYYDSKFIMVNSGHATTSYYGKVNLLPVWIYGKNTAGYDAPTNDALCDLYAYNINNKIPTATYATQTLTLGSEFNLYTSGDSAMAPTLHIWGKIVTLTGCVTPKSNFAANDSNHLICTIPEGYRPQQVMYMIMQGSTRNKWQLSIGSAGSVNMSRYRTIGSWVSCTAGSWLPFNATWIIP